jgi:hypothetical protein
MLDVRYTDTVHRHPWYHLQSAIGSSPFTAPMAGVGLSDAFAASQWTPRTWHETLGLWDHQWLVLWNMTFILLVLNREWMGCWWLLRWLLIISQWITPENSLLNTSKTKICIQLGSLWNHCEIHIFFAYCASLYVYDIWNELFEQNPWPKEMAHSLGNLLVPKCSIPMLPTVFLLLVLSPHLHLHHHFLESRATATSSTAATQSSSSASSAA